MFVHRTQVRLKHTDATGVLYFPEQFKFASETLEEFLKDRGFSWKDLMASAYFLPVVHAEADYAAPLKVGDELEVCLTVAKVGTSSMTFHYSLRDPARNLEVGQVTTVHAVVDQQTRKSVPIPDFLRAILEGRNS